MLSIPFFYACFVTFPSSKPGCISLLPADQTDVTITFLKKNIYKCLAVCRLILMNCSDIVRRVSSHLIDISAVLLADYTEELCQIYFVVITGFNCGCHLCIRRVTDNDTLASCCCQLLYGSSNFLGNMSLVNVLNLNAQCFCCLVKDQFTLRSQYVGRRPDRNTNLDVAVVYCCSCLGSCRCVFGICSSICCGRTRSSTSGKSDCHDGGQRCCGHFFNDFFHSLSSQLLVDLINDCDYIIWFTINLCNLIQEFSFFKLYFFIVIFSFYCRYFTLMFGTFVYYH